MKKSFVLLFVSFCICLISCSSDDNDDDTNPCINGAHYILQIYPNEECECASEKEDCGIIYVITEQQFNCIFRVESSEGCKFIDSSICAGISFSGNVKSLGWIPCS